MAERIIVIIRKKVVKFSPQSYTVFNDGNLRGFFFYFTISLLIAEEGPGVVLCDHFSMPVVNTLDIFLRTGSHPITYNPDFHVFVIFFFNNTFIQHEDYSEFELSYLRQ